MNLSEFIEIYRDSITAAVMESYPPLYVPNGHQVPDNLKRSPLGLQKETIMGVVKSLETYQGTTVVGEMGTGKTYVALVAAHMAGFQRVLVLCPPHLTAKWKREVEMTAPGVTGVIVNSITDLIKVQQMPAPMIVIMSRERAKLSYRWKPSYLPARENTVSLAIRCPSCFAVIKDDEGIYIEASTLNRRKHRCLECDGPLWSADHSGPKRYALAEYVKRRMEHFFDLLIMDEVHEYKAKGSAQGNAAGLLADVIGKILNLSGTLMGGYSSTLFYLLYRFSPAIRDRYAWNEERKWVEDYGFIERTITEKESKEDGRTSRRKSNRTSVRERPGLLPGALFHIIGNSAFLKVADVAKDLPPYVEQVEFCFMQDEQESNYEYLYERMRAALKEALQDNSSRMLGIYLQSLLSYPDGVCQGEEVFDPRSGDLIVRVAPMTEDAIYPKEQALINRILDEKKQGRRVLVYVTHTERRDMTARLDRLLSDQGLRVSVLKSDTVQPDKREKWIADQIKMAVDVVICHPKLVQTGLDLVDFPTICWYECEYSIYTMRQASRRSWRIGQTEPVKVVYMAYRNTLQADALQLIASKMKASLAVEGELPEEGLTAYGNTGNDMMMALARQVVSGIKLPDIADDLSFTTTNREDDEWLSDPVTIEEPVVPAAVSEVVDWDDLFRQQKVKAGQQIAMLI